MKRKIPYNGRYLWPPRPERAVSRDTVPSFEAKGWVAQKKANGNCCVLVLAPGCRMIYDRRGAVKDWSILQSDVDMLQKKLAVDGPAAIACEFVNDKTPKVKNTLFVFDILATNGRCLSGTTFGSRAAMVENLLPGERRAGRVDVTKTLWLARTFDKNLVAAFDALASPEDEGIVIKNPDAVLSSCLKEGLDGGWQVKLRRPTKNFSY